MWKVLKIISTPVRGHRIKEARWVLKKILPGVIKITPSGFGVRQLAFIKAFFSNAFRLPLLHEQKYSDV